MEEQGPNDTAYELRDELILDSETGGEDAIEAEPGVLLLSSELPPDAVIRKIEVGPRVSAFNPAVIEEDRAVRAELAKAWHVSQSPLKTGNPVLQESRPAATIRTLVKRVVRETGRPAAPDDGATELASILSEARAIASDYGALKARTRRALYEALGRTYDFTIRADAEPEECARLIEEAGLMVQDRAPYSPIVKLVFGADYDKTRVAEFAAAIAYARRRELPSGAFTAFLEQFEGGLKAVVGLERLIRGSKPGEAEGGARAEASPAIARRLRAFEPMGWDALRSEGDEFALVMARRLPDGSIAMVGEVPRDIALLEKAARKLVAELDRAAEPAAEPAGHHPEGV